MSLFPTRIVVIVRVSGCLSNDCIFAYFLAIDAKERQYWVDRLRAVAEYHSEKAEQHPLVSKLYE